MPAQDQHIQLGSLPEEVRKKAIAVIALLMEQAMNAGWQIRHTLDNHWAKSLLGFACRNGVINATPSTDQGRK
ncbi:MAG: hypothetical protein LKM36_09420 [Flavobacteriales bacterium]|jgi:hypothetical protein|nr:hypothetical protein [Flavobacteriales bacterium]MBP9160035.1 hypothetical protein [Flavobacteriales bacterium]MCI1753066.1 hypothetical protein [Flavobacteriales bacterium]